MDSSNPSATETRRPAPVGARTLAVRAWRATRMWWDAGSAQFRGTVVLLLVLGSLVAWLLPIAAERLIDGDEGYLLMAARLVSQGRWPYRDFFFTQTPLLPAVFGILFWALGRSWLCARLLAGLIAVALGLLVYREARLATRRSSAALFATALYALSGATIGWLTIVKGYGLSALLTMAATYLVGRTVRRSSAEPGGAHPNLVLLAAGLAVGLAASTRLYTIVVMPTLALYLVGKLGLSSARRLLSFAVGCVLGLGPCMVCYAVAGRAFLFGTFFYHRIREYGQNSLFGSAEAKLPSILKTLGLDSHASYSERQWMGLAILATFALLLRLRARKSAESPAGWVALALVGASTLPNPFLPQYLCLAVPFLAIEGGRLLAGLLDADWGRKWRLWPVAVAAVGIGYLSYHGWVAHYDRGRLLHNGGGVPGIVSSDRVARWRIETVEAVAREIDTHHIPVAASWWPGYFVSSQTSIAVELANDFGFRVADVLSSEDRRHFHVASHAEVGDMIVRGQPRMFVEGNWATHPWAGWLPEHGYQIRGTIENVRVWTREE